MAKQEGPSAGQGLLLQRTHGTPGPCLPPTASLPTCLEALLPGVEVQRGQLAKVGVAHVHVEGLALINVGAAVCTTRHQRVGSQQRNTQYPSLFGALNLISLLPSCVP